MGNIDGVGIIRRLQRYLEFFHGLHVELLDLNNFLGLTLLIGNGPVQIEPDIFLILFDLLGNLHENLWLADDFCEFLELEIRAEKRVF